MLPVDGTASRARSLGCTLNPGQSHALFALTCLCPAGGASPSETWACVLGAECQAAAVLFASDLHTEHQAPSRDQGFWGQRVAEGVPR